MEKQKVITVGLNGFECNKANKGCEALTYSFLKILGDCIRDIKINLIVLNTANDFRDLKDYYSFIESIHTIPYPGKNPICWKYMIDEIKKCTVVYDVTYGDSFSDIYGKKWLIKTNLIKQAIINSKIPLILLPQTYGPFSNKFLEKWSIRIVERSCYIFSRDNESTVFLNSKINLNRDIVTTTDMAFELPYKKSYMDSEKTKIGINVSGLLWNDDNNRFELKLNYKKTIIHLIERLTSDNHNEIFIIPHVIDVNKGNITDNDLIPGSELEKIFGNRIIVAPAFKNAIEAKNFISGMDCFIGARMHSTIAAISTGVPTIPFSYSKKFEGLFSSLNYPYLISAKQVDDTNAIDRIIEYISIRNRLQEKVLESRDIAFKNNEILKIELTKIMSMSIDTK